MHEVFLRNDGSCYIISRCLLKRLFAVNTFRDAHVAATVLFSHGNHQFAIFLLSVEIVSKINLFVIMGPSILPILRLGRNITLQRKLMIDRKKTFDGFLRAGS